MINTDFIDKSISGASDLIKSLSAGRAFFLAIYICMLLVIGAMVFEFFTGYFFWGRFEAKLSLVERLEETQKLPAEDAQELQKIRSELISVLGRYKADKADNMVRVSDEAVKRWSALFKEAAKILSGAAVGILMLLHVLIAWPSPESKETLSGAIIFLFVGSLIGYAMPDLWLFPYLNMLITPVLILTFIFIYNKLVPDG